MRNDRKCYLPGFQVRERFDEQSTENLQLLSSHAQAVFKKEKKKKINFEFPWNPHQGG